MREFLLRLRLPLLFAALVALTLLSMLADRRSVAEGGGDLGWPLGFVLEVVAPVQKALLFPVDLARRGWTQYVGLVDLQAENERLRARLAELEETNLQYSEALVASGHLQRIAQMHERFAVPLLPSEVVGHDDGRKIGPAVRQASEAAFDPACQRIGRVDAGAAENAGVRFVFADRFFGLDNVVSPDIDLQRDI